MAWSANALGHKAIAREVQGGGTETVRVITIALRLTGEQHAKSLNGCHDGGGKERRGATHRSVGF